MAAVVCGLEGLNLSAIAANCKRADFVHLVSFLETLKGK
ncbi:hypothetical protein CfE428DRAFT_6040 [Chthoniobacter flavus Ellin428]|uniref:Uncharacterized protein n=1 Tax=Chthoniobacter flavus Ellin428 TaxID=497964 RepID=B4DAU9_9BACT|nr:hypothetical protein CfE428DRAFT_6040 [Chthoniobacter flavus Ellin428]